MTNGALPTLPMGGRPEPEVGRRAHQATASRRRGPGLTAALALTGRPGRRRADPAIPPQQEVDGRPRPRSSQGDRRRVGAGRARRAAEQRLQATQIAAAQAAEAFNGRSYEAQLAAKAAARPSGAPRPRAPTPNASAQAYASVVTSAYQLVPGLTALSAIVQADGIDEVIESTSALQNAEDAIDEPVRRLPCRRHARRGRRRPGRGGARGRRGREGRGQAGHATAARDRRRAPPSRRPRRSRPSGTG